jgi:prevent-host-death family protein
VDEPISAADANRRFSQLLRGVREDNATYVVTSHGKPVARITPVGPDATASASALERLLKRLESEPVMNIGKVTRDELYDDPE